MILMQKPQMIFIRAFLAVAIILYILAPVPAFTQPSIALDLDALIEEARQNNPDILAARKRWESARARIPQAKSLDNPNVGLTFENIPRGTLKINETMPGDRMLSFSQFLPFFGKQSLKGKIALVESQMDAGGYKAQELEVINQVKISYYALFMNRKEADFKKQNLELLKAMFKAAGAGYSVGSIAQEQVFKIHSEVARLNTDIRNLEQERSALITRLNALLNRDPESGLDIAGLSEETNFNQDIKSLYQSAILNQPELLVFALAIEKNKHAKSLAKKSFFPDLMAGIIQRGIASGTLGPWDLMLSFSVPLWFWTKQRYEVKEAISNLEEAQAAYNAMQNKAFAQVKDLYARIEMAKNKIKLYKTNLIPVLESSFDSSLAGFRTGKGDFMALLDTQRMLVEARMDYYRALVDYNMNLADLEKAVGVDLR